MPLFILDNIGQLNSNVKGTRRTWLTRNIVLDPSKEYEIGLRFLSLTVNGTSSALADDEFAFPFFIKTNLVKRGDYMLSKADFTPTTEQILNFVDLNESSPELAGTQAKRNVEYNTPYYADMAKIDTNEIFIEFVDICGEPLELQDAGSTIIECTIYTEYREKRK